MARPHNLLKFAKTLHAIMPHTINVQTTNLSDIPEIGESSNMRRVASHLVVTL